MDMQTTNINRSVLHKSSSKLCSQCSSTAHFTCLNHCSDVFCGKCSTKHQIAVKQCMHNLAEQLKQCRVDSTDVRNETDMKFLRASQKTVQQTQYTINSLINDIQQRKDVIVKEIEHNLELRQKQRQEQTDSTLLTHEEVIDYTHLLNKFLKRDELLNTETMTTIQQRLNARNSVDASIPEIKQPSVELKEFNVNEVVQLRFTPQIDSSLTKKLNSKGSITVTVRLNQRKTFHNPSQSSFSMGRHPIVISLNSNYCETFFCRRSDNSLILLSTNNIDIINRGSGVEMSIRLSKILGTTKDRILAGTWCDHCQRLILNGHHHMYFFSTQHQQHADKFRCEPSNSDQYCSSRFIGCTYQGSIIYAYKSAANIYKIERLVHPNLPLDNSIYSPIDDNQPLVRSGKHEYIHGYVAAMCITHNRIAIVYRYLSSDKQHLNHNFCLFDFDLNKIHANDIILPVYIKWITAITSFRNDDEYLFCDPRGQQLLLYRSLDHVLTRRFHIGAINASCLTDGKLVLWLQKQYSSSPNGKLHFITPPHIEKITTVPKSVPLLLSK